MRRLPLFAGLVVGLTCLAPASARAQSNEAEAAIHDLADVTEHGAKAGEGRDLVILPVPVSNPSVGNGLAIAAMALYTPAGSIDPWATGIGALYTDSGSWAVGVVQKASLDDGRLRLLAFGGVGDFHLDFYGIGPDAGSRGESIAIEQSGSFALAHALIRVTEGLYVGPLVRYLEVDTKLDAGELDLPEIDIPPFELASRTIGLGVAAEYDTRDSEYAPRHGLYGTLQYYRADDDLGSDFSYDHTQAALNAYYPLSETSVVAGRLAVCDAGDGAPFYDLCAFGQSNDLRGYVSGRYRDHATIAAQVELRQTLRGRFGLAVFAGVGTAASGLSELFDGEPLPAAGVGLRYQASEAYGVNVSVDYAVGRDDGALYFRIGEAF